jgi:hypothetical protein
LHRESSRSLCANSRLVEGGVSMAPKKALVPISAKGESADWVSGKANQLRVGSLFLIHLQVLFPLEPSEC